jgi:hypothetical protein
LKLPSAEITARKSRGEQLPFVDIQVPSVPFDLGGTLTGRILSHWHEGSELPAVPYPKLVGRMVLATIQETLAQELVAVYSLVTDINQDE